MSSLSLEICLLIVDDDRDLLKIVENHLLKRYPEIDVVVAESAQEALRVIEESDVDAIVSDYYLGPNNMNGLELLEWLRNSGNSTPFVMFTGQGREEVAIRSLNLGADFYLKKDEMDFQSLFTELINQVRQAVSLRRMERALKHSESRFRTIFEEAPIGVVQVKPDGLIVDANQTIVSMLDFSKDELKTMNISSLMKPSGEDHDRNSVLEMIAGFKEPSIVEGIITSKEGNEISAHMRVSTVDTREQSHFAIIMIEDVSRQKANEAALRKVENDLIASEEQYQDTLNSMSDAIHVIDRDFEIELLNPAFTKWVVELGLDTKVIGKNLFDAFPFLEERVRDEYEQVFKSGTTLITNELTIVDGREIITETHKIPISSGGRVSQIITVIQDITEKKHTENTFRFTQFAIDHSSDAAFWMGADAKFIYVNESACKILGYSKDELLSMTVHDIDPLFPKEVWKEHWAELKEKRFMTIESQHRAKSGTIIPIELKLNFIEFDGKEYNCAFSTDITQRRVVEEKIEENRGFLSRVIESLTHPFYVIDANDYSILLANNAARIGPLSTATKCHVLTHGDPEPCQGVHHVCPLEEVKRTRKPTVVEHVHYDITGIPRTFQVHGFPILDRSGNVIQMIEYNLDISERRDALQQLKAQKEELSRFAHNMSHDLSNYLLKIDGVTSELEMDSENCNTDQIRKLIQEMKDLLQHSVMLADAGLVIEKKEIIDLGDIISQLAKSHIPDGIEFHLTSLPLIRADSTKLSQVIHNLFDNAVKHGNPSKIEVSSRECDDKITIVISNNGLPFPEDIRKRLNTGKIIIDEKSRGFGLDIVRRIVNAHGWSIELLDEPQTALAINIPRSEIV